MKKKYNNAKVEIISAEASAWMIPISFPDDPHALPERHWRPGPGASYDPKGSIL